MQVKLLKTYKGRFPGEEITVNELEWGYLFDQNAAVKVEKKVVKKQLKAEPIETKELKQVETRETKEEKPKPKRTRKPKKE